MARISLVFIAVAFLHGNPAQALTGSGDEPTNANNQPKQPTWASRGPLPSGQAAGVIPAQGTDIQDTQFWEDAGILTLLAAGVAGVLVGGRTSATVTTSGTAVTSSH